MATALRASASNDADERIAASIRAHNADYARAHEYSSKLRADTAARNAAADGSQNSALSAARVNARVARAAARARRAAKQARIAQAAAESRILQRRKAISSGIIDTQVVPLVKSFRGEHWDLQPRPPITPAPARIVTPDDHPLWQFFRSKDSALTHPDVYDDLGRPWGVPELRRKQYEDLHTLWYVCLRELNLLKTETSALHRVLRRGRVESAKSMLSEPVDAVQITMKNIRTVLLERYKAWEHAQQIIAESDGDLLKELESKYTENGLENVLEETTENSEVVKV